MNSFLLSIVRFVTCRIRLFCFFFLIFAIATSIYPQSRDYPSDSSSNMERIAGAFGFRFNQTFNPDNALSVVYDSDNLPLYLVEPITPNMMFSEYFITLSPMTSRISSIYARSTAEDISTCVVSRDRLVNSLGRRYGEVMSPGNNETWDSNSVNQRYIYQEKRFIIVDCQEIESSPYLVIYYADEDLMELSRTQQSAARAGNFRRPPQQHQQQQQQLRQQPPPRQQQPGVDTSGL